MSSQFPIKQWSENPASNNVAGAPFIEGQQASSLNNGGRDLMSAIREQWVDAQWFEYGTTTENPTDGHSFTWVDSDTFKVDGQDVTSIYQKGRRIRVRGTLTGTVYGTITSTAFVTDTTVVSAFDGAASLVNEVLTVAVGILTPINPSFADFTPGDRLFFPQQIPPPKWDIVTGLDDRTILTVDANGGGLGGNWDNAEGLTMPHTHTGTTDIESDTSEPSAGGFDQRVATDDHSHPFTTDQPSSDAVISDGTWRPAHIETVIGQYNP